MIGRLLGERYEIISEIAEGGMAYVYKGKCNKLNRIVAIKVLKPEFNNNREIVQKFKREATAVATLNDDNIVDVLDVGSQDDINYIVMEYIDGKTLKDLIVEYNKIPYEVAINIGIQIAKALDCAHRNNIIHRDIKPHNVLITREGQVKVTDFGIAKSSNSSTLTSTSSVLGSAHYFSPEQAKGSHIDERTDIYSLGIVLYEMVTGRVPFDADSPVSVAVKHIQECPISPKEITSNIPDSLNELILACMEKLPENRYQSARDVMRDLGRIRENPNVNLGIGYFTDDTQSTRVMDAVTSQIPVAGYAEGDEYYGDEYYDEYGYDENAPYDEQYAEEYDNQYAEEYDDQYDDEEEHDEFWDDDEEDDKSKSKALKSKAEKDAKKKKAIIAGIVSIIAVIVIGVGMFFFLGKGGSSSGSGDEIAVPDVLGKTEEDAKKILEDAGFKMTTVDHVKSDKPKGTIIEMYPDAGTKKEKGSEVRVVVSGEEEEETDKSDKSKMPNLRGMTESEAKAELKSYGITNVSTKSEYSNEVEEGKVISQTPDPKSSISKDTKVTLTISNGKKNDDSGDMVEVPQVVGMLEDAAKGALEDRGFEVVVKDTKVDSSRKDGAVIDCSVAAKTKVKKGSKITITVGRYAGENKIDTTPLIGMSKADADAWAKSNGVTINYSGPTNDPKAKVTNITEKEVTKGSVVNVTLAVS